MLNLKRIFSDYHNEARTFSELLPWMAQISDEVVIQKNGSFLVCFTIEGIDMEGMMPGDVDHYADLAEHALRAFDDRITVWATIRRRRTYVYPKASFPHPMSEFIDDAWEGEFKSGGQFINQYFFSFTYTPPAGAQSFFEKVAYHSLRGKSFLRSVARSAKESLSKTDNVGAQIEQIEQFLNDLYDKLAGFEQTLSDIGMSLLKGSDLRVFLYKMANPASEDQELIRDQAFAEPEVPGYLDGYLCTNSLHRHQNYLEFRGEGKPKYAGVISVKDWPPSTYPGIWDELAAVPGEVTISQCFRFVDSDQAAKFIADKERHHKNMAVKFKAYLKQAITKEEPSDFDEGRMILAADASAALAERTLGKTFGYYNLTLVAYGDTTGEVDAVLLHLSKVLRESGFLLHREGMHILSAWTGTLPGQASSTVRWFFSKAANLADLLPLRTLHVGSKVNPYLTEQTGRPQPALTVLATEYNTPFYFSFHVGDLAHALVVGPSRTGKSSLLNFLVSQFRKHHPCNVYIFDKDRSCRISTLLQGGTHIDLLAKDGTRPKLNPVSLVTNPRHRSWLAEWLVILLSSNGYRLSTDDHTAVWEAIKSTAAYTDPQWHRLSTIHRHLNSHLANELEIWVEGGKYGEFFDNVEDSFTLSDFTCCEMGGVLGYPSVAAAFLEYAFYRIDERLDGTPTLIEIEEAWFMIDHPIFGPKLDNWLRTLAKKNTFLIMATQSLDEIVKSEIFTSIVTNIPNKIFLPNKDAGAYEEMYTNCFQLNHAQVARIKTAERKRDYYFTSGDISRMVQARFPKEIMAATRSDTLAQDVFDKFYSQRESNPSWDRDYVSALCK